MDSDLSIKIHIYNVLKIFCTSCVKKIKMDVEVLILYSFIIFESLNNIVKIVLLLLY